MQLNVTKPSTFYVQFTEIMPRTFILANLNEKEECYFRYLDGKTPRIKFNVPDPGVYETNVPVKIVKEVDIEIPSRFPKLPPANRDRWQPVKQVYNKDLDRITTTPIRIYSEIGVVEYGDRYLSYTKPVQKFLYFHELGHMFYREEENCDMYALINFIRAGYNQSTAFYLMEHILHRTPQKIDRMRALFNNIQKLRQ